MQNNDATLGVTSTCATGNLKMVVNTITDATTGMNKAKIAAAMNWTAFAMKDTNDACTATGSYTWAD